MRPLPPIPQQYPPIPRPAPGRPRPSQIPTEGPDLSGVPGAKGTEFAPAPSTPSEYILQSEDGRLGKLAITKQGNPVWQAITNPRTAKKSLQDRAGRQIVDLQQTEFDQLFPATPEEFAPNLIEEAKSRFIADKKIPVSVPRTAPGKATEPPPVSPVVSADPFGGMLGVGKYTAQEWADATVKLGTAIGQVADAWFVQPLRQAGLVAPGAEEAAAIEAGRIAPSLGSVSPEETSRAFAASAPAAGVLGMLGVRPFGRPAPRRPQQLPVTAEAHAKMADFSSKLDAIQALANDPSTSAAAKANYQEIISRLRSSHGVAPEPASRPAATRIASEPPVATPEPPPAGPPKTAAPGPSVPPVVEQPLPPAQVPREPIAPEPIGVGRWTVEPMTPGGMMSPVVLGAPTVPAEPPSATQIGPPAETPTSTPAAPQPAALSPDAQARIAAEATPYGQAMAIKAETLRAEHGGEIPRMVLQNQNGTLFAVLHPGTGAKPFRVTRFDARGWQGHQSFDTPEAALRNAVDEGGFDTLAPDQGILRQFSQTPEWKAGIERQIIKDVWDSLRGQRAASEWYVRQPTEAQLALAQNPEALAELRAGKIPTPQAKQTGWSIPAPVSALIRLPQVFPEQMQPPFAKKGAIEAARANIAGGKPGTVEITITDRGPLVTDGRHTLVAAQEANLETVPIRIVRNASILKGKTLQAAAEGLGIIGAPQPQAGQPASPLAELRAGKIPTPVVPAPPPTGPPPAATATKDIHALALQHGFNENLARTVLAFLRGLPNDSTQGLTYKQLQGHIRRVVPGKRKQLMDEVYLPYMRKLSDLGIIGRWYTADGDPVYTLRVQKPSGLFTDEEMAAKEAEAAALRTETPIPAPPQAAPIPAPIPADLQDGRRVEGDAVSRPTASAPAALAGPDVPPPASGPASSLPERIAPSSTVEELHPKQPWKQEQEPGRHKYRAWLAQVGKRLSSEMQGQEILDEMDANNVSPRDIQERFWREVYPSLPVEAQRYFERYVENLTGTKIEGVTSVNPKTGEVTRAKTLADLVAFTDMPDTVHGLEGIERGYVALMAEGVRRIEAPTEPAEAPVLQAKQPWEMTPDEWSAQPDGKKAADILAFGKISQEQREVLSGQLTGKYGLDPYSPEATETLRQFGIDLSGQAHRDMVERAVKRGEAVPYKILGYHRDLKLSQYDKEKLQAAHTKQEPAPTPKPTTVLEQVKGRPAPGRARGRQPALIPPTLAEAKGMTDRILDLSSKLDEGVTDQEIDVLVSDAKAALQQAEGYIGNLPVGPEQSRLNAALKTLRSSVDDFELSSAPTGWEQSNLVDERVEKRGGIRERLRGRVAPKEVTPPPVDETQAAVDATMNAMHARNIAERDRIVAAERPIAAPPTPSRTLRGRKPTPAITASPGEATSEAIARAVEEVGEADAFFKLLNNPKAYGLPLGFTVGKTNLSAGRGKTSRGWIVRYGEGNTAVGTGYTRESALKEALGKVIDLTEAIKEGERRRESDREEPPTPPSRAAPRRKRLARP